MIKNKISIISSLLFFFISVIVLQAQVPVGATVLFEENWESATVNIVPARWSGDIDDNTILDEGWVVGNGPSSMSETGPSAANGGSQYMYFESGSPAGPDAMADLFSPSIMISGPNPTLSFALFMYGSDLKMLDVSVIHGRGTTSLQTYTTEIQSSKTDPWSLQSFDLSAYNGQSVQILFAAQKMNVGLGDIAIDSIAIYSQPTAQLIPTLSQWGMIFLGLSLLIILIVAKATENQKVIS